MRCLGTGRLDDGCILPERPLGRLGSTACAALLLAALQLAVVPTSALAAGTSLGDGTEADAGPEGGATTEESAGRAAEERGESPRQGPSGRGPFIPWLDLLTLRSATIVQHLRPMRSPYEGENSLPGAGETRVSQSLLLALGKRITPNLSAFMDLRYLGGGGLGDESGMGSYPNADFSLGAKQASPYVLRAYLRGTHSLSGETEPVGGDVGTIRGEQPAERIEWKLGRFTPSDDFDKLRYASTSLTEFMNLGLVNNAAWDNAQNARGTTDGAMVALIRERWELRVGSFRMPREPNGPKLDGSLRARNDNIELTVKGEGEEPWLLRVLHFRNSARMGRYQTVLSAAAAQSTTPALEDDRGPLRLKRGYTMNFELPLADRGETGLFACAGWNDGKTEDFSFTEVNRNVCAGAQLAGARLGRPADRFGAAVLVSGLSRPHREYLAAGGVGFRLGDGALRYGREKVLELYWRIQLAKNVQLTPDFQFIANPGFNRDRGPARVFSLRLLMLL